MKRTLFLRALSHAFTSRKTLLAGCSMLAVCSGAVTAGTEDGNWYFFGDSNIGQGNFSAITGTRGEDFFPYSSNNGFERDTNGLIWAEMMGRDVDILLDPDLDSENINFAISGAHMTNGGDLLHYGIETGVRIQTAGFVDLVNNDIIQPTADDVAFMIAGSNDFLDRLAVGESPNVISTDVAEATVANLQDLASTGLKTVILSEIQPIHYAPIFSKDDETQAQISEIVQASNTELFATIEASGVREKINIVTLKYGALMDYLRSHKTLLGFDEIDTACYNDDDDTLCASDIEGQNRYIFLDELHMTEKAQSYVANWWSATLTGANGDAARMVGRMPDTLQYSAEAINGRFGYYRSHSTKETLNIFADIYYGKPTMKSIDSNLALDLTMKGALIGVESMLGKNLFLGGGLSFMDNKAQFSDKSSFDSKTKALHAWVDYEVSQLTFSVSGTYGDVDINNISRKTGLPDYAAHGKTDGRFWNISAGAATTYNLGAFKVRLDGSYNYGKTSLDSFTETGAQGLALSYDKQRKTSHWIESTTRLEAPSITLGKGIEVLPFASVNWRHAIKDDSHQVTSQLVDNTALQSMIRTEGTAKNRYGAEAGLQVAFSNHWSLIARYSQTWADDIAKGSSFNLGFNKKF